MNLELSTGMFVGCTTCEQTPIMPSDSEKNSVMFEAWLNCGGNWKQSQLYINCKTKNTSKRKGVRKWMLRKDIEAKFGEENAEAIVLRKLGDEKLRETEVKKHPDLPDSVDMMQFLIFDSEEEIEQEEEVMEMLYKLAEGPDSQSSMSYDDDSSSKKKKKKDKREGKSDAKSPATQLSSLHFCLKLSIYL